MRRWLAIAAILAIIIAACTSGGIECMEPPVGELQAESPFEVAVEPNPVTAGGEATLSVSPSEETPADVNGGLGADWECWDGSEWVQTHRIVRGFDFGQPATIDLGSDSTIAIPDVGVQVPSSRQIVIPDVEPGTYRLTDYLYDNESNLIGYEFVEVIEG